MCTVAYLVSYFPFFIFSSASPAFVEPPLPVFDSPCWCQLMTVFLLEYISSSLPYYPWPPLCSVEGAFTTAVHEKTPKSYILRTAQWHPAMTWTRENCSSEGDGEGEGGAANKGRRETGRVFALHDPLESIIVVRWCSIAHTHTHTHTHALALARNPLITKAKSPASFFYVASLAEICTTPLRPYTTLYYITRLPYLPYPTVPTLPPS